MGFKVHCSTWGAHIPPPHLTRVLPFHGTMILIVPPTLNKPKFTKNGVPTAPHFY